MTICAVHLQIEQKLNHIKTVLKKKLMKSCFMVSFVQESSLQNQFRSGDSLDGRQGSYVIPESFRSNS